MFWALQIVPAVPSWLPPAVVLVGMELTFLWIAKEELLPQISPTIGVTNLERKAILVTFVSGVLITSMPLIQVFGLRAPFMILLFALGQSIEGVASIRFYVRVGQWLNSEGSGLDSKWAKARLTELKYRFKYRVFIYFTILFSVSLIVSLLSVTNLRIPPLRIFALFWTISMLIISVFGLNWKLRDIDNQLPRTARLGLILAISGAVTFGFGSWEIELAAQAIGAVGYALGFWYGAIVLVSRHRSQTVARLRTKLGVG